jgi:hypothetical protein
VGGLEVRIEAILKGPQILHFDVVEQAVDAGEEDRNLFFCGERLELRLLEKLGKTLAAASCCVTCRGQTELREGGEFTVLRGSSFRVAPTCLVALTGAEKPTRDTERPTLTADDAPVEEVSFEKIWPSVME